MDEQSEISSYVKVFRSTDFFSQIDSLLKRMLSWSDHLYSGIINAIENSLQSYDEYSIDYSLRSLSVTNDHSPESYHIEIAEDESLLPLWTNRDD